MFAIRRTAWLAGRGVNQLRLKPPPPKIDLPVVRCSCFCSSSSNLKNIVQLQVSRGCGNVLDKPELNLRYGIVNIQTRSFRTTAPRNVVPPVLLMLLSKIGQLGAIFAGRKFRNLPPEQKAIYLAKAKKHRRYLYALLVAIGLGGVVYYFEHIEEAPITKRKRFLAFSEEQLNVMADVELKALLELHKDKLVPATDPRHQRVFRIAQKLVDANRELLEKYGKNKEWTLSLIDDKNISNAFVLSCGSIFVFTGLLDLCDEEGPSDSTLAIFLAHELSHVVLSHAREQASVLHILDAVLIVPFLILWSLVPSDATAALLQWLLGRVSDIIFTLPYGRTLETEADEVGLILAARACFDVRECLIWKKLEMRMKQEGIPQVDFLSTHPSGDSRYENLSSKLGEALSIREECKCPRLSFMDEAKRLRDYDNRLKQAKQNSTVLIAKPLKL